MWPAWTTIKFCIYELSLSLSHLICTSWESSFERVCKNNVVIIYVHSSNFLCLVFGFICKESQRLLEYIDEVVEQ